MEGLEPQPASILQEQDGGLVYRKPDPQKLMMMTELEPSPIQKQQIISGRHDDKSAGHPGINKIIELVTRDFL